MDCRKAREGASTQRRSSLRERWRKRRLAADWATAREAIRAGADEGRSPGRPGTGNSRTSSCAIAWLRGLRFSRETRAMIPS